MNLQQLLSTITFTVRYSALKDSAASFRHLLPPDDVRKLDRAMVRKTDDGFVITSQITYVGEAAEGVLSLPRKPFEDERIAVHITSDSTNSSFEMKGVRYDLRDFDTLKKVLDIKFGPKFCDEHGINKCSSKTTEPDGSPAKDLFISAFQGRPSAEGHSALGLDYEAIEAAW